MGNTPDHVCVGFNNRDWIIYLNDPRQSGGRDQGTGSFKDAVSLTDEISIFSPSACQWGLGVAAHLGW